LEDLDKRLAKTRLAYKQAELLILLVPISSVIGFDAGKSQELDVFAAAQSLTDLKADFGSAGENSYPNAIRGHVACLLEELRGRAGIGRCRLAIWMKQPYKQRPPLVFTFAATVRLLNAYYPQRQGQPGIVIATSRSHSPTAFASAFLPLVSKGIGTAAAFRPVQKPKFFSVCTV